MEHAANLGYEEPELYRFILHALADTLRKDLSTEQLTALVLETGSFGVKAMALLDKANTNSYGNPEITHVNIGVRNNPGHPDQRTRSERHGRIACPDRRNRVRCLYT